jgi:hypothetical protein
MVRRENMDFKFRMGKVIVRFESDDSEQLAKPIWEGSLARVTAAQSWVANAIGPFGHFIEGSDGSIRPGDLYFALTTSDYDFKLLEGTISGFESAPEGAVS